MTKIITREDSPLAVRVDHPEQLDLLLKDEEKSYVQTFLKYLQDIVLEVYVGGGLIEKVLFGGERPNDIDLLAITEKVAYLPHIVSNELVELVNKNKNIINLGNGQNFLSLPKYNSSSDSKGEEIQYILKETGKGMYFNANQFWIGQKDGIAHNELKNFIVTPNGHAKGRPIDLTVVPKVETEKGRYNFFK